jgi:hypothetical protein
VLEGLLGERVAGRGGPGEAGQTGLVQRARRVQDGVVGGRGGQPGRVEEVLAVVEQLRPGVTGHRELRVAVPGELQRPLVEGVRAQRLHHLGGRGLVHQLVGGQRAHRRQRL